VPDGISTVFDARGRKLLPDRDGTIVVDEDQVIPLLRAGFARVVV
jgi:hypothetical protein